MKYWMWAIEIVGRDCKVVRILTSPFCIDGACDYMIRSLEVAFPSPGLCECRWLHEERVLSCS